MLSGATGTTATRIFNERKILISRATGFKTLTNRAASDF
jgi:hypothetical protein